MIRTGFDSLWVRTRWPRWTFVIGLILGIFLGWFFHGLVGFAVRFFFVLILLIPVALLIVAYLRRSGRDASYPPRYDEEGTAQEYIDIDPVFPDLPSRRGDEVMRDPDRGSRRRNSDFGGS